MAKSIKFDDDVYLSAKSVLVSDMSLDRHIQRSFLNSGSPIHLAAPDGQYCSFIVGGMMQNIGGILLAIVRNYNTLTVKDLKTMSDFSNTNLNITISNQGGVDLTTNQEAPSYLTSIIF